MKMIGIYLAAGRSSRMGFDKRYLPFNHEPLGSIALKKALRSKLDHTLVVVRRGETFGWLDSSFFCDSFRSQWSPVVCEHASQGQSFSLKSGVIRAVEEGGDAVIILLADQPFISTVFINHLIDAYAAERETAAYIAAGNNGVPMPPLLISGSCFPYLHQLTGDQGARGILRKDLVHKGKIIPQDPPFFYDVDTFAQYSGCTRKTGKK
ncbi:NTP transferase domain-containing protein [Halobacillus rhizosphaerae]|uniref:NTP transferase domain-containing protein n=1 Tax=Halobacillus rhizosphaerae TaxID=3064889 RepID=UPI00398B28BF